MSGDWPGIPAAAPDAARLDRQEIVWLLVAILSILLVIQVPYLLAFLSAPPDLAFSGALFYLHDSNSYLAAIRQGIEGNWLFYDLYTPEPHQPGPLHLIYTTWGRIGAAAGTSPAVTFDLARLMHGLILLAALYWFLTLCLPQRDQRRAAFLLLAFTSGLGWLLLPFGEISVLGDRAPDFWMPEVSTFLTLFIFPHFAAATSLMVLAFGGLLLAFRHGRLAPALGAALAAFLLAWIHPFLLVPVYGVAGSYLVWQAIRCREVPWRSAGWLALCVAPSALAVAYLQFVVIAPNPVFQGWMDQNAQASPNLLAYLVGFGLLVPLALIGAIQVLRGRFGLDPFPLFWVGVGLLLVYTPFAVQRRFAEGLQIPLVVLAVLGWQGFRLSLQGRPLPRVLLTTLLVVGLVTSTMLNWASAVTRAAGRDPSVFISRYEAGAMEWLGEHSAWSDTVLASYESGSYIPAWAGNRVVIGHGAETIKLEEKDRAVRSFFQDSTSPQVRNEIIQQYGVRYLYHSPNERFLGDYDPGADPVWEPVFANEEVTVYRYTGTLEGE
ncbi:MAG: hypothetical protein GWN58_55990 [Anaerolineae bacterium]|nr:hypothetical protein [Anaerolineae bacterium]